MNRIEFIVGGVTQEQDCALVDGRVGDGDAPIRVHDTFTAIRSYTIRRDGGVLEAVDGPAKPVRLTVECIEAYGRSLDFIVGGMTARLHVSGEGLDRLAADRILS